MQFVDERLVVMKKIFLALVSIFVLLALCGCTTAFINAPDRDLNKNMIVIALTGAKSPKNV